jgi:hypothetical protein
VAGSRLFQRLLSPLLALRIPGAAGDALRPSDQVLPKFPAAACPSRDCSRSRSGSAGPSCCPSGERGSPSSCPEADARGAGLAAEVGGKPRTVKPLGAAPLHRLRPLVPREGRTVACSPPAAACCLRGGRANASLVAEGAKALRRSGGRPGCLWAGAYAWSRLAGRAWGDGAPGGGGGSRRRVEACGGRGPDGAAGVGGHLRVAVVIRGVVATFGAAGCACGARGGAGRRQPRSCQDRPASRGMRAARRERRPRFDLEVSPGTAHRPQSARGRPARRDRGPRPQVSSPKTTALSQNAAASGPEVPPSA